MNNFCSTKFAATLHVCKSKFVKGFARRFKSSSIIMGIETSCDDTSVALIDSSNRSVIHHLKVSQTKIHQKSDGIVPVEAGKEHQRILPGLVERLFGESGIPIEQVGLIGVTRGPGLASSLIVGLQMAKQLSIKHQIPMIGVHHMAGHALVARMEFHIDYPFLCLLVSGGHTLLLKVFSQTGFEFIGGTLDDSIGEALDKACRYLQIPWDLEKGPAASLEMHAKLGNPEGIEFKLPFSGKDSRRNFNFSYSGLKTALQVKIKKALQATQQESLTLEEKCNFAASYQAACIEHLLQRLKRYVKQNPYETTLPLVVGGGVASNQFLRSRLFSFTNGYGMRLFFPSPHLCTDNAIMIAWTAHEWYNLNSSSFYCKSHNPISLGFIPKWPTNAIHSYTNL